MESQISKQRIRLVFFCNVSNVLTGREVENSSHDFDTSVGPAQDATRGKGAGGPTKPAVQAAATKPIDPPQCDEKIASNILSSPMDGFHTVEEWINQAHSLRWYLATPANEDGTLPPGAQKLAFTPIDDGTCNVKSSVNIITAFHGSDGKCNGHYLQPLAPREPAFRLDLTKFSDEDVKHILNSPGFQIQYEKDGRHPSIPMDRQDAMDRTETRTLHHGFAVFGDAWDSLANEPTQCFGTWAQNKLGYLSEMQQKASPENPVTDIFPFLTIKAAEIMRGPRDLFYGSKDPDTGIEIKSKVLGCMNFTTTTVKLVEGENEDGQADPDKSPLQQRLSGVFLNVPAEPVSTSAAYCNGPVSEDDFCADNVLIALDFEICTNSTLINTMPLLPDTDCSVCLEKLDEQQVKLSCKHSLHSACIEALFEHAAKNGCQHIQCPNCRQVTSSTNLPNLEQYGASEHVAALQRRREEQQQNMEKSSQYHWWCLNPHYKVQWRVFNQIKCESITEKMQWILHSEDLMLDNYELSLRHVACMFRQWMENARRKSRKILLEIRVFTITMSNDLAEEWSASRTILQQIRNCSYNMSNDDNQERIENRMPELETLMADLKQQTEKDTVSNDDKRQRIETDMQKLNKLIEQLKQQTEKEAELGKYINVANEHVQVVISDLRFNLTESFSLDRLREWQNANVNTILLPSGWKKFCVSDADVEKFGHILRAQYPKHFRAPESDDQKREIEDRPSKKQKSDDDASDGEHV